MHGTTNIVWLIYIKTDLSYARVKHLDFYSRARAMDPGWELFRMKRQRNYRHQSKIAGLKSALSWIKAVTNHIFVLWNAIFFAGTLVCCALQHICRELDELPRNNHVLTGSNFSYGSFTWKPRQGESTRPKSREVSWPNGRPYVDNEIVWW